VPGLSFSMPYGSPAPTKRSSLTNSANDAPMEAPAVAPVAAPVHSSSMGPISSNLQTLTASPAASPTFQPNERGGTSSANSSERSAPIDNEMKKSGREHLSAGVIAGISCGVAAVALLALFAAKKTLEKKPELSQGSVSDGEISSMQSVAADGMQNVALH
jgi:hypothetical protein